MEKTHDEEMAIDLWELISALKKRALIILAACLLGGVVAGCAFLVELDELNGREKIGDYDYKVLMHY